MVFTNINPACPCPVAHVTQWPKTLQRALKKRLVLLLIQDWLLLSTPVPVPSSRSGSLAPANRKQGPTSWRAIRCLPLLHQPQNCACCACMVISKMQRSSVQRPGPGGRVSSRKQSSSSVTAHTPQRKGSKVGHLKEIHGTRVLHISEIDCSPFARLQLVHPLSDAAGQLQCTKRC